jgi:hypothetical protein
MTNDKLFNNKDGEQAPSLSLMPQVWTVMSAPEVSAAIELYEVSCRSPAPPVFTRPRQEERFREQEIGDGTLAEMVFSAPLQNERSTLVVRGCFFRKSPPPPCVLVAETVPLFVRAVELRTELATDKDARAENPSDFARLIRNCADESRTATVPDRSDAAADGSVILVLTA